jgi:hypothetical protein
MSVPGVGVTLVVYGNVKHASVLSGRHRATFTTTALGESTLTRSTRGFVAG